jgi:hypothetical protein
MLLSMESIDRPALACLASWLMFDPIRIAVRRQEEEAAQYVFRAEAEGAVLQPNEAADQ